MNSAIYEAIAEVLAEHRKKISSDVAALTDALKAQIEGIEVKPAERGNGIKAVDLHADSSAFDLVFDDGESVTVPLPAAKNGRDADTEEIVKALKANDNFIKSVTGERGADADPVLIAKQLAANEKFMEAVKGARGEQGEAGKDGLDCPVIDLTMCKAGQSIERGALVKHRGGIWQATRKANGSPEDEPTAYRLVINGVSGVAVEFDLYERQYTITTECANDSRETVKFLDLPRFIEPSDNVKKIAGDFYFYEDCLHYVDKFEKWQEINLRGRRGRNGATGVGIAGIKMLDEGVMELSLTNGETLNVDFMPAMLLAIKTAFSDVIDQYFKNELANFKASIVAELKNELRKQEQAEPKNAIKRFAGAWRSDVKHKAGDVVSATQGLFLAKKDTSAPVLTNDWECLMPANQTQLVI